MPELTALAQRQHGCLHHRQVLSVMSRYALNRRLGRGIFIPAAPNVVGLAPWRSSVAGRGWAAILSVGPPAAVTGISAAVLHGFPDVADDGEVTLVVPGTRRGPCRRGLVVRRASDWDDRSWSRRAGLPVASLADTVIEVATVLPVGRTQAIVAQLLWRRLRPEDLYSRLACGRAGSAVVGRILDELSDGHRSVAERRVAAGLRRRRVPPFTTNLVMGDGRGPVAELDFLWRSLRVAVQIDGWRYHAEGTFQHDHDVSTTLVVDSDYVVLRFTGADVEHRLEWLLDQIEAVLRRRRAGLPSGPMNPRRSCLATDRARPGWSGSTRGV